MKTTSAVIVRHLRCAKSPVTSFEVRRLQAAVTQEAAVSSLWGRHFYKASETTHRTMVKENATHVHVFKQHTHTAGRTLFTGCK